MNQDRGSDKQQQNICYQRGGNDFDNILEWNINDSGFGRQSQQKNIQMPQIQYLMDRESHQKQLDEDYAEKRSMMSIEDQNLQKQSIQSFQSRGSNFNIFNRFSGYNQFEQPKNSITFSQTFEQQQKFSLEKSEKSEQSEKQSIEQKDQSIRQSNQSNQKSKDNELEIVFEWQDESNNQNALEQLINQLTLEKQSEIIPDRLSLLPQQKQGCICKKTQCLKFYCQCFQQSKYCNEYCECLDCCNNEQHKDLIEQTRNLITRNQNEEIKCFCKKSKCQKKYCECFQAGKKCGIECKCEGCLNNDINKEDLLHEGQRLSELYTQQQKRVQLS